MFTYAKTVNLLCWRFKDLGEETSQVHDSNPCSNPTSPLSFQSNISAPAENIGCSGTEDFDDKPSLLEVSDNCRVFEDEHFMIYYVIQ